jgi:hypothetical protein
MREEARDLHLVPFSTKQTKLIRLNANHCYVTKTQVWCISERLRR